MFYDACDGDVLTTEYRDEHGTSAYRFPSLTLEWVRVRKRAPVGRIRRTGAIAEMQRSIAAVASAASTCERREGPCGPTVVTRRAALLSLRASTATRLSLCDEVSATEILSLRRIVGRVTDDGRRGPLPAVWQRPAARVVCIVEETAQAHRRRYGCALLNNHHGAITSRYPTPCCSPGFTSRSVVARPAQRLGRAQLRPTYGHDDDDAESADACQAGSVVTIRVISLAFRQPLGMRRAASRSRRS